MGRKCRKCYLPIGQTETQCPSCGTYNAIAQGPAPNSYPMTMFKFLTCFWLIASCVVWFLCALNFVGQAIAYIEQVKQYEKLASIYGNSLQIGVAKSQRNWMFVMAAASIIMGIIALDARSSLANYSSSGPKTFSDYLIACIVFFGLYGIALSSGGVTIFYAQLFTGIPAAVINVVCIICSKRYFEKRQELFIY